MSSFLSKIGGALVKPALKATLAEFDASEHGGAPLLGLNGLVVKSHGNATRKDICNAVMQCIRFSDAEINEKIKSRLE